MQDNNPELYAQLAQMLRDAGIAVHRMYEPTQMVRDGDGAVREILAYSRMSESLEAAVEYLTKNETNRAFLLSVYTVQFSEPPSMSWPFPTSASAEVLAAIKCEVVTKYIIRGHFE